MFLRIPFVIQTPGTYSLFENTNWNPENSNETAIVINVNDVVIEGGGHCIEQTNHIKNATFIRVSHGVSGVTIKDLKIKHVSGSCIELQGENENIVMSNVKMENCGNTGVTLLSMPGLPFIYKKWSFAIQVLKNSKKVTIQNCTFHECGFRRDVPLEQVPLCTGAILVHQCKDVTVKGCTIDGVIAKDAAWPFVVSDVDSMVIYDVFVTHVFADKSAKAFHIFDADATITECNEPNIISRVGPRQFIEYLDDIFDDHMDTSNVTNSELDSPQKSLQVSLLKNVIPRVEEMEERCFQEHTWHEFRTLGRLVCHHAHRKTKIAGIFAVWVKLFCERVFGVRVKVESGFANLYLHGNTPLPLHRDKFKKWIFGLSFGETRTLDFIPDAPEGIAASFEMSSGDVLLFSPDVNNHYQHRMLAEPQKQGRRINLTYFFEVLPDQDEAKLLVSDIDRQKIPSFEEAEKRLKKV